MMPHGSRSPGAASSNHSSGAAASGNGSPETRVTAFSPEDVRMKSLLDNGGGTRAHANGAMVFAAR